MKKICSIEFIEKENKSGCIEKCDVKINFYHDKSIVNEYEIIENLEIDNTGINLKNKVVKNIKLPVKSELCKTNSLYFDACIFIQKYDLNFFEFNESISFKNCIFVNDLRILGEFNKTVCFENSTFIGKTVSFQESLFSNFVFNRVTVNNCMIDFQQTIFYSSNINFSNLSLNNSNLLFNNSSFARNSDVFDLIAVKSDVNSKIIFNMVDFNFTEVRLFNSKISRLEFIDCTFECNRFDFDLECEILIMQDCKNFKILTLSKLTNLKHLNIYKFVNVGKVIFDQELTYYINAINSNEKIIRVNGFKYKTPDNLERKSELFSFMDFLNLNQSSYIKEIKNEIEILDKMDMMSMESYESMKIFLSYSWLDDKLADNIDDKFIDIGITLLRDRRDIKYRNSIKEFMKQIRNEDYVLIIISDNYLKSSNCMYEVTEFIKDENYKERILPIVKSDVKIFNALDRSKYIRYWQNEYNKLKDETSDIDELNKLDNIKEMLRYEKIQRELPDFMNTISDMNLIVCNNDISDEDFEKIKILLFEGL